MHRVVVGRVTGIFTDFNDIDVVDLVKHHIIDRTEATLANLRENGEECRYEIEEVDTRVFDFVVYLTDNQIVLWRLHGGADMDSYDPTRYQ